MSFLYPRLLTIKRPAAQTGEGAVAYGGTTEAAEATLFTGIKASIQERREGQANTVKLPGDGLRPSWYVFIPRNQLAAGSINDRDIVIDDLGQRHQVTANYFDSLGYRLTVERLEA